MELQQARVDNAVSAGERLGAVVDVLKVRFDMDAYDARLAELLDSKGNNSAPIGLADFERQLHFAGFPEGFQPHMYRRYVGDPQAGLRPTPIERLTDPVLGDRVVFDQREDTHRYVQAFKARGALGEVLGLLAERPEVRVFTTGSTGNHAKGLVAAVNLLNASLIESGAVRVNEYGEVYAEDTERLFQAHVYCASTTDPERLRSLEDGGAKVIAKFPTLENATKRAEHDAGTSKKAAFIHPFAADGVIALQGTLAMELLLNIAQQGMDLREKPVNLRVAVGGGGMYAAQVAVFEHAMNRGLLHPESRVIAVEAENNDSANRRINNGQSLTPNTLDTLAAGIATLESDEQNVAVIASRSPGGVRVVPVASMVRAAEILANAHRGVPPEFAGTLSLASLLQEVDAGVASDAVEVTVTCGGNASPSQLYKQAGSSLGSAVFALLSKNALEPGTDPVRVSPEPYRRPVRMPLRVIGQSFVTV